MTTTLPLTIRWSPTLRYGRVLFVLFAYHGRDRDERPHGFLERRESPAVRGHRIVHRDHYANPRALPYVMALAGRAAEALCDQAPDIVIDQRWDTDPSAEFAPWCRNVARADVAEETAWQHGLLADLPQYDHVVLIYPDALGLGCDGAERAALSRHASVLIVNGRRRAFRLDRSLHGQLQLQRFLAHSRLVERVLAAVIPPIAARLARRDRDLSPHV
jgi:hypothetical protein